MTIESIKKRGFGISIIVFPVMLLAGFLMHPNILNLEALQTVEQLVGRFHNQPIFHFGHLLVMFAVPVIMIALISFMNVLQGKGKQLGFWGGVIGLFGAFILAVDKGALCLVLSAFDTLPEAQFQEFAPFLSVVVNKAGLLWVVWLLPLLPLLPIGASIQALGLLKEKFISKWQGVCIIFGLLLLNNPDIELISATGALLMCAGYIPWGVRILQGRMNCSSTSCPIYDKKKDKNFKCHKPCN
ncbi:MAG: hypothetical protein A2266_10770 [Bacteroidetes bacterium RIFOXYA12_FULL_40_10]|nr:MAG: hypothetical protein A2266_10770 [Bacteroidetes bacterium RIFOXYA12_FULL_40_10]